MIFSCLAFCCVGSGSLVFLGYRSGVASAEEDGKFIQSAFAALSSDGYVLKESQKYFVPIKFEITRKQTQVALDAIKAGLGSFKSIGDVKGFYMKSGTGGTSHRVTYDANFEKGGAVLQCVILNPGKTDQRIYSWTINSPLLNR